VAAVHIGYNKEQIFYTGTVMLYDCQLFAVGYRETNGKVSEHVETIMHRHSRHNTNI